MKNYLIHMRIKAFLPSFLFVLTGYALSPLKLGILETIVNLIMLFIVYSVLLFGGAAAINSHFDGDSGPLNYLDRPPELPKYLHFYSYFLFGLSIVLANIFFNIFTSSLILAASILGIVYSQPIIRKKRAKDIPILDNLVNALGCGFLSVLIGRSVSATNISEIFTLQTILVGLAFTFTVAGTYPATQIFQINNSIYSEINYSTYLGPKKAIRVGLGLIAVGLSLLGVLFINLQFPQSFGMAGLFQLLFLSFIASGIIHLYKWSRKVDLANHKMGSKVLFFFLAGRIFWIAAAWMSHDL